MSKKALHSLHFLPCFSTSFHQYYCYLREIWRKRSPSNTEHNHDINYCAICDFGMTIVAQIWRAIISALAHMHHDAVRHHRRQLGLPVIIDKFPFWIEDVEDNCVVHNVIFVLINGP